jgi:hypothetical protein
VLIVNLNTALDPHFFEVAQAERLDHVPTNVHHNHIGHRLIQWFHREFGRSGCSRHHCGPSCCNRSVPLLMLTLCHIGRLNPQAMKSFAIVLSTIVFFVKRKIDLARVIAYLRL